MIRKLLFNMQGGLKLQEEYLNCACGCCILTNKIPKGKMLENIYSYNILYNIKELFLIIDKNKIEKSQKTHIKLLKKSQLKKEFKD